MWNNTQQWAETKTQNETQAKNDENAKAKAEADKWGNENEEVKISKSELERLKKLEETDANKSKAIEEERKARKEAEARLKAIDDEKAKVKEEELKKKWEYEIIIKQKDEIIASKDKEIETYKWFYDKAIAETTAENEKLLKEIPNEEQEFVKEAIDWKELLAQNKLLKNFVEKFKKPDFWKKAWEWDSKAWDEKRKAEEEEAKKDWFKWLAWKIALDLFKKRTE